MLSDNILKDIVIITLLKGIDDYFARIEPVAPNQKHAGATTAKAKKPLLYLPHDTVKKVIDNSKKKSRPLLFKRDSGAKLNYERAVYFKNLLV